MTTTSPPVFQAPAGRRVPRHSSTMGCACSAEREGEAHCSTPGEALGVPWSQRPAETHSANYTISAPGMKANAGDFEVRVLVDMRGAPFPSPPSRLARARSRGWGWPPVLIFFLRFAEGMKGIIRGSRPGPPPVPPCPPLPFQRTKTINPLTFPNSEDAGGARALKKALRAGRGRV